MARAFRRALRRARTACSHTSRKGNAIHQQLAHQQIILFSRSGLYQENTAIMSNEGTEFKTEEIKEKLEGNSALTAPYRSNMY